MHSIILEQRISVSFVKRGTLKHVFFVSYSLSCGYFVYLSQWDWVHSERQLLLRPPSQKRATSLYFTAIRFGLNAPPNGLIGSVFVPFTVVVIWYLDCFCTLWPCGDVIFAMLIIISSGRVIVFESWWNIWLSQARLLVTTSCLVPDSVITWFCGRCRQETVFVCRTLQFVVVGCEKILVHCFYNTFSTD